MKKKLTFVSLFSGGGGFQIGFENAGYKCLLSSDIDSDAARTHKKNFPNIPFIEKDIRQLDYKEILKK